MARRHSGSHALATLLSTLASGLLIAYYKQQLNTIIDVVDPVGRWLILTFELPMTTEVMTMVLVASLLSSLWGIGFHYAHR
jgi:hypothetical protein